MRVYLDNNVFADIEDGVYQLGDFLSIPNAEYYYSDVHMSELLNGLDNVIIGLKERRLKTIESICRKRFLAQNDDGRVCLAECEPRQALENAVQFGFFRGYLNRLARSFTPNRQGILEELNWNAREVGGYNPNEVFEKIDEKMLASKYHCGIRDYLCWSEAYTGRAIYSCLFNLLDMVSYRKDKDNASRLYDASHAFYAHRCDVLVSNDTRMRLKAGAVYHYLKVETKVLCTNSYLSSIA